MAEPSDRMDWSGINRIMWAYYILFFVAVFAPNVTFLGLNVRLVLNAALGSSFGMVTQAITGRIEAYRPTSVLAAKRVNEQIKSFASMINTVAAATVSLFALSEIAKSFEGISNVKVMVAIGAGLFVHNGARKMLSFIKDESADAYKLEAADAAITRS